MAMRKGLFRPRRLARVWGFLLLVGVLQAAPVVAQPHCSHTLNTETTHWDTGQFPGTSNTEGWDWTREFFTDLHTHMDGEITSVVSPFYPASNASSNPNVDHFGAAYLASGSDPLVLDFHPEDGWELLIKDFGTAQKPVDRPLFALYNVYQGILRVFILLTDHPGENVQSLAVKASFPEIYRKTALLSHGELPSQGVQHFLPTLQITSPNQYLNTVEKRWWSYVELPMAYDPCTCDLQEHVSRLRLAITYIKQATLTLEGEGTGVIEQVIDNKGTKTESLHGFNLEGLSKAGTAGYKAFKTYNDWSKGIGKVLENREKTIKSTKNKAVKDLLESMGPVADGAAVAKEILPYVGIAAGIVDFFLGFGKKAAKDPVPMMFTNRMRYRLEGTYEEEAPASYHGFPTPGSTANSNTTATYNNILGVLNLLSTPRVSVTTYRQGWNTCQFRGRDFVEYALMDEPRLVVNPASGLELIEVRGAFHFTPKYEADHIVDDYFRVSKEKFGPVLLGPRRLDDPEDFHYFQGPDRSLTYEKHLAAQGLEIADWVVPPGGPARSIRGITFATPFMPLGCLKDQRIRIFENFKDIELKFKVIATLARKDLPTAQPIVVVQSYDVRLEPWKEKQNYNVTCNISGLYISVLDPSPIPRCHDDLLVEFGTDQTLEDEVFYFSGTVFVGGTLELNGTIEVDEGESVTLVAEQIVVSPGAEIPPEVTLITDLESFCTCGGEATDADIAAVCGSDDYLARAIQ